MKTTSRKKGFTLIEIIVTLVILGVLMAIAVPNYFLMVNKSKAAEVLMTLKDMKDKSLLCVLAHPDVFWPEINNLCAIPGSSQSVNYVSLAVNFLSINVVAVGATGNDANGLTSSDSIIILYDSHNGSIIQCNPQGVFVGLCPG